MNRKWCLAAAVLCACSSLAKELTELEVLTSGPTRCTYEHAFEMYGAHCGGLRLDHIPSLRTNIEILDFSDNKLQELNSKALSSYTSIRFLYLSENQILTIEDDAFSALTDLQTLDLSKNVILYLPPSILQLPSLRKLYLGGNPLIYKSFDSFAENKDIRAPLELLDISNCKIKILPDWGLLPHLVFYNISANPLKSLEKKHFAVICNLAKIDLTESIADISPCALKPTINWFQEKRVYFQLDDFSKLNSKEFKMCPDGVESEALNNTFQACKKVPLQTAIRRPSRQKWLTISGGLASFLVGFILLLFAIHRYNVWKTKTVHIKTTNMKGASDKQAAAVLLNNAS